jgi:hypothetical protein
MKIQNYSRTRTIGHPPQDIAAIEASKNPLSRDFRHRSIFDFCDNVGPEADVSARSQQFVGPIMIRRWGREEWRITPLAPIRTARCADKRTSSCCRLQSLFVRRVGKTRGIVYPKSTWLPARSAPRPLRCCGLSTTVAPIHWPSWYRRCRMTALAWSTPASRIRPQPRSWRPL